MRFGNVPLAKLGGLVDVQAEVMRSRTLDSAPAKVEVGGGVVDRIAADDQQHSTAPAFISAMSCPQRSDLIFRRPSSGVGVDDRRADVASAALIACARA